MSEEKKLSGVFYIDGSCRPSNPGSIGWGMHGYLYKDTVAKANVINGFVHTDYGYIKETELSAPRKDKVVPQLVEPLEYVDGLGSYDGTKTNQVAEALAALELFKFLEQQDLANVRIFTDSDYVVHCINDWAKGWEKNGWVKRDQQPVSNREWLEPAYKALLRVRAKGTEVTLSWIQSHNGHVGNERVDYLAKIGSGHSMVRSLIHSVDRYPAKKFWENEVERNPYIAFSRLYFNSVREYHRPGVYHLAQSNDADFIIGKPASPSGYAVLYLNEPDPIIELIKQKQFDFSRDVNVIMLMKLDTVYSKQVYPWLMNHGALTMNGQKYGHSMVMMDKNVVTMEQQPTGLSMRALDYFGMLEEMLIAYQNSLVTEQPMSLGGVQPKVHDITHYFFNDVPNKKPGSTGTKKELKSEFVVGFKNMFVDIEEEHHGKNIKIKVPYALGLDCLPRNNLKYLEDKNPKIVMLTWPEGNILRHASVIQSDHGIGIWSNYFANQVLIPS